MSEYRHVERPFLTQLRGLRWGVIDQGGSKCEVGSAKFENARGLAGGEGAISGFQTLDFTLRTSAMKAGG
jgi:hypothetical protein